MSPSPVDALFSCVWRNLWRWPPLKRKKKRVKIKHKLCYSTPTLRGKASEEDTTETPMWVNRGGKLTIRQEDQGQLFGINGSMDRKLKAAQ